MQHQNASAALDDLARRANQLAGQQTDFQNRLRQMVSGNQAGQTRQQADRMGGEKEQMAEKLKQLEKDMSETARSLAGAQNPAVSTKLREALGEAQQQELEMHMRQLGQWIRQGYGMQAWVRESTITQGLNQLSQQHPGCAKGHGAERPARQRSGRRQSRSREGFGATRSRTQPLAAVATRTARQRQQWK